MDLLVILFVVLVILFILVAAAAVAAVAARVVPRRMYVDEVAAVFGGGTKRSSMRIKDLIKNPRSKSEAAVIGALEEITGEPFPTVFPKWLMWKGSTLELDGYNEQLKIALEFSGPLHTKWNPRVESYNRYFDRIVRDVVKRRLCRKRGVSLIVVDMTLPRIHWRNYLLSRLHDIGYLKDKPVEYIPEQTAEPFRNPQIEEELGLTTEMTAAMRI